MNSFTGEHYTPGSCCKNIAFFVNEYNNLSENNYIFVESHVQNMDLCVNLTFDLDYTSVCLTPFTNNSVEDL